MPETGRLLFSLTKNGNVIGSLGNTSVADGKWHHVLISYTDQSGYASYYVDGKRDAVTFLGAQLAEGQNTANVIVGDEGFTGDIDFMTIRNYDLAATKPPAPDIISPRNGETVFGSTHNFSWQSTADYYNVDRYALEIKQPGENPCHIDGNSTACIFLDDHLVASTSQEVDGLVAGNGYVWAVLAHNSSGWSERVLNYFDVPLSFWDGWNRIIWPNITDKTMADLPSGCTVEDETRNLWFYPFAKNFLPFPTPFIPTKTYFFSCR